MFLTYNLKHNKDFSKELFLAKKDMILQSGHKAIPAKMSGILVKISHCKPNTKVWKTWDQKNIKR